MNRQARFSLASKGFLSAAVIMLIMGAERPLSQPLSARPVNTGTAMADWIVENRQ